MVDSAPSVYARTPKTVQPIKHSQIANYLAQCLKPGSVVIVDAMCFIETDPELCYSIYESAVRNGSELILSGLSNASPVSEVMENEADLWLRLEN